MEYNNRLMDNKKRLEFWNELNRTTNENDLIQFERHIPKYLYRYRKVDSNSLSALLNNRLYFSTSNYYDDPFDCVLGVDVEKIACKHFLYEIKKYIISEHKLVFDEYFKLSKNFYKEIYEF